MKKLLALGLLILLTSSFSAVNAKAIKSDISNIIDNFGVNTDSLSLSIKEVNKNKVLYALNDKSLMNPASVQKILTMPAVIDTLGNEYEFSTDLYLRAEGEYVLKLSGDPYLTTKDLKTLVKNIDKNAKKIYIDDSALDSKTWGEGWQWDDDLNILMPRFSSYNLDKNLIKLTVIPNKNGFATIINPSQYPLVFFNNITSSDKTKIDIQRDNAVSANTIILSGTVARPTTIYIPTINLKRYFQVQLTKALEERSIYLKEGFIVDKVKSTDILDSSVKHKIDQAINDVLKNSNNLVSETTFKIAGAKHNNIETGSDSAGLKMFNDYCNKNKLDNSLIRITDASGVSKNNLVSTDFITDYLIINKDNQIMSYLAKPGEGTLIHRMLPLKDNLKAKTGTLSDISSIAGYLTTKKGSKLVFSIIVNDVKLSASDKKMLEDFIIREAYLRL